MEPIRLARRMAWAALMVAAAMAWAGVSFRVRQARAMTNCMDSHQAVPGLQSVARASRPSAARIFWAGVYLSSARPKGVHGRETATVSDPARAEISASEV